MRYYALWITRDGKREFDGPFETIEQARDGVPADTMATLITQPVPMTLWEYLNALPILDARIVPVE